MSNIAQKIDSIIQVRNSRVPMIDEAIEELEKCTSTVRRLEKLQAACINGEFVADGEIVERIKSIQLGTFFSSSNSYKQKLLKLKDRFSRKELHLSFVGRARQGKSLVIQKISGLDSSIIPSCDGSDCTGAKSIITNSDNENVRAEITFYTEYEMIGIINRYLTEILHDNSMNISSVSEIQSLNIDNIRLDYSQVKESQYLGHLKKYVSHINIFRDNLGKVITVPKDDIEKYVAQYSNSDFDTKYYNYLGVKSANILTKFPYNDAGKIVLLDTIGIGTTSLGVEDSMLDTVENDSDAIIFMFRPDSLGPRVSQDEIEVIDKISKRVGAEYAKEMFFWVINKVSEGKGRNIDYIRGVIEQIEMGNYPVSEKLQVDCINSDEVENKLLTPVLDKISSKIHDVDKLIIESANTAGQSLFSEYAIICSSMDKIFMNCATEDMKRSMADTIKKTYETRLFNELRELYLQKYNKLRNEPCEKLKNASEKVLKSLFSFIPEKETIVSYLNSAKDQHETLRICFNRLRLDIIDAFLTLDEDLDELITDMKNETLDIFRNEDYGRLGMLVGKENDNSLPDNWIDAFLDKTDARSKYSTIADALLDFKQFSCTVHGFLIYEIRNQLDRIDQTLIKQLPRISSDLTNKEGIAEEIIEILNDAIYNIHNEIRIILSELYKVPNKAMFAAIKDLYDRVALESRDAKDKFSVDNRWRYLYEDWMHILWKQQYEEKLSVQNKAKDINELVDDIKKYNKKTSFNVSF